MLNASSAAAPFGSPQLVRFKSIRNVEYARVNGLALNLDASVPQTEPRSPAVILVHGGGWVRGDRRVDVAPLFEPLNNAGFAWFSIDYRLAADVTQFGVAIEDVQQAVRFVRSRAGEFHVDPDRIVLLGESAGGQLAAMAALRAAPGVCLKGVIALYAPTDLVSLAKESDYIPAGIRNSIRGTPWESLLMAGLAQLSPVNNLRPDMPPFLLIHGTQDALVPFAQSRDMCKRMLQANASCEVYPVLGGGHGLRWWESDPKLANGYKSKLIDWLRRQLAAPSGGRS
ncbi:MAG: alpha/beta hydrolase [Acidobacteriaceae bacterium]|nr:alpha/beta hydrolase [Acidobacteriaceae bacterium]